MARKIHFEVLILKENFEDFERDFGIFTGIFMRFREFIREFGDFCSILSDFREFSGVEGNFRDFTGFRDFFGIPKRFSWDFCEGVRGFSE